MVLSKLKYAVITITVLLIISFSTAGVFGYMWGKSNAENREPKEDKKIYLQLKHEQDSIINIAQQHIESLTDSINLLVNSAVELNRGISVSRNSIERDKQKMHEEINSVPTLSMAEQLKLFARQSEEYRP